MLDPIKFMKQYAKWNQDARNELNELGYTETRNKNGDVLVYYSFSEDGTVFKTVNGAKGRNEFQSGFVPNKVTPWKESKHYIELN